MTSEFAWLLERTLDSARMTQENVRTIRREIGLKLGRFEYYTNVQVVPKRGGGCIFCGAVVNLRKNSYFVKCGQ